MGKWFVIWDDELKRFGAASAFSRSWIKDLFSSPFWDYIPDKPFDSLGSEFTVSNGELQIAGIDASKIVSGVLSLARIPSLPRSKISDLFDSPFWENIPDKPFETLGSEFNVSNGKLEISSIDFSKITNRLSSLMTFDSSLVPNADGAYDLGSDGKWWKDGYIRGLKIYDNRNITPSVGDYSREVSLEFKTGSAIGLPRLYYGLISIAPWSDDTGGGNHQLAFGYGEIWYRYGTRSSGWGSWRQLFPVLDIDSLKIGGTEVINSSRVLKNIASVAGSLLPDANGAYDLGSPSARWRRGYFGGSVYSGGHFALFDGTIHDGNIGAEETSALLALLSLVQNDWFLFNPPDKYEYNDGSGWVEASIGDDLRSIFMGKKGEFSIPAGRKVRLTWSDLTANHYFQLFYIIGYGKFTKITFEGSSDGTNWTKIGEWSATNPGGNKAVLIWKYVRTATYGQYFRITIENGDIDAKIWRMGMIYTLPNSEDHNWRRLLFDWDFDRNLFTRSISPITDDTYDLGSSSLRWRNGYFAGAVDAGSIKVGGTEVIDSSRVLKNVSADASIITSGVFDVDRIPSLPRSKISDFFSSPFWDNIPDKPSQFPPEPHTHSRDDITDFWSTPFWDNIPDKPSTFPPSAHTHSVSDITFDGSIIPDEDGAYDLGSYEVRWRDAFFRGSVTASGTGTFGALNISGVPVITSSRDLVSISSVQTHLIPSPDNTRDLGSSTNRWRNLYVVNLNTGDIIFRNGWRITEFDENGKQMNGLRILDEDGEEIFKIAEDGLYFKGKKIA